VSKNRNRRFNPVALTGGMFYWAYGSNLNVAAMARRCPGAQKIKKLILPEATLVFRGVADVEYHSDDVVYGGLWYISPDHERTLDTYEGVRGQTGLYTKEYMIIRFKGSEATHRCLFYQMVRQQNVMPPNEHYINVIAEGYQDFDLPLEALDKALRSAWNNKEPNDWLRTRHAKRGGGKLARTIIINNANEEV
jgi:hypothetical protein